MIDGKLYVCVCKGVCVYAPKYRTLAEHWSVWLSTKQMWADS